MFLRLTSEEFNHHSIHTDQRFLLDHVPLTVRILIFEENIQTRKCTIAKNSKKENNFVKKVIVLIKELNTIYIHNKENLESIVQEFANNMNDIWYKYPKLVNVMKHSKSWQNENYQNFLETYRNLRQLDNWKVFKKAVKISKWEFFNNKIQEILNKRKDPWEFINWVKKRKLLAIKAIKHNSHLYLEIEDLWQAFYESFNLAQY